MPLALQLFRRRYVELTDFAKSLELSSSKDQRIRVHAQKNNSETDLETEIRKLEDSFDDLVRGINRIGPGWAAFKRGLGVLVDDVRKERGDYDEFFHISKKERKGDMNSRMAAISKDLENYRAVLGAITSSLRRSGYLRESTAKRLKGNYPSLLNGSRIVARVWMDKSFKAKLLSNAREAVRELSIPPGRLGQLHVVENTDKVHNVIVCTLCSCYPYDLLGNAPYWYKQDYYKTRIISDPRKTLKQMFKLTIPPEREIRVHDSTSDVRYMVLPRRPKGTKKLSEAELEKLITKASLIGTGETLSA